MWNSKRAITVAKQDPDTLNGVIERIEEMTTKLGEQEKKMKEVEDKGKNKKYDRPIFGNESSVGYWHIGG